MPLIHLDELACLDLLKDFSEVLVPDGVWEEVCLPKESTLYIRSSLLRDIIGQVESSAP